MASSDRLGFYLDEHLPLAAAREARRRGIDVIVANDAGNRTASDPTHLRFAASSGRVVITMDADFVSMHYGDAGHSGVVLLRRRYSVGKLVELLMIMDGAGTKADFEGRLLYF